MPRTWNIRVEELTFSRARNAERSQGPGLLVPKKGLEPPHPCGYMDLNHARLPIPPLRPVDYLRSRGRLCLSEELPFYSTGTRTRVKHCGRPASARNQQLSYSNHLSDNSQRCSILELARWTGIPGIACSESSFQVSLHAG